MFVARHPLSLSLSLSLHAIPVNLEVMERDCVCVCVFGGRDADRRRTMCEMLGGERGALRFNET